MDRWRIYSNGKWREAGEPKRKVRANKQRDRAAQIADERWAWIQQYWASQEAQRVG